MIARESGGNAQAVNPASGAGGLYQFLPGTWQSLGYSGLARTITPAAGMTISQRFTVRRPEKNSSQGHSNRITVNDH